MNKTPTVLIWNAHWETLGGGERYALELGAALDQNGFNVFFAGTGDCPTPKLQEIFNLSFSKQKYLKVVSEAEVYLLARVSDIFINASFGSRLSAPHLNSIYICHFPFIRKLQKVARRYWHAHGVTQNNVKRLYADPSKSLVIDSESTIRLSRNTQLKSSPPKGSWHLTKETNNAESQLVEFTSELEKGLYFLENSSPDKSTVYINGLAGPTKLNLFRDFIMRTLFFKDTYKQVWVHSHFVEKWAREYWDRDPFVIYPPVSLINVKNSERNPYKIVSVGRFMSKKSGHSKNQLELVKAFSKLTKNSRQPWELHLVGGVSEDQQKYFEKVKNHSEGLNVTLYPNSPYEELMKLYSSSSFYWHASGLKQPKAHPERLEHFGITVVEAMSAGLVPFVFDLGGPAEILCDYPELTFGSISELASKTLAFENNDMSQLRIEMEKISSKFGSEWFYRNAISKIYTLDYFLKFKNEK
jgi:glycosyltransferase involved in cell wall biosynthesis